MPQVGYSATSRDLSNKNFHKYFLRVVPSDKLQAQVLIDLMLAHNWTYITVAYTEGKCKVFRCLRRRCFMYRFTFRQLACNGSERMKNERPLESRDVIGRKCWI